jgi:hypothetical protein
MAILFDKPSVANKAGINWNEKADLSEYLYLPERAVEKKLFVSAFDKFNSAPTRLK